VIVGYTIVNEKPISSTTGRRRGSRAFVQNTSSCPFVDVVNTDPDGQIPGANDPALEALAAAARRMYASFP
jgi:hypothetical protein